MPEENPTTLRTEGEGTGEKRTRRGLIEWGIHVLGAGATLMIGVPVLGTLLSPVFARSDQDDWTPIGPSEKFPEGETVRTVFKVKKKDGWMEIENPVTVYVTRRGSEYQVLSATCTHLGCAVNWDAAKKHYACPCHDGFFNPEGKVISGPPPAPLASLKARVNQEGQLEVQTV